MLGWKNAQTTCDEVTEAWDMGWSRPAGISVPRGEKKLSSAGESGWEDQQETRWIGGSCRQVYLVATWRRQTSELERCRHCEVTLEMDPGAGMSQC